MTRPTHPESRSAFEPSSGELRRLGYAVVDLMLEAVQGEVRDPVLPSASGEQVRERLDEPLPRGGSSPLELLDFIRTDLMPLHRKNGHPRFFGYVCASADPVGALFDGLASLFNQNVTAWRSAPGATEMERTVVRWLDEWVGFDSGGRGLLVSGGSAANATAIAAALRRAASASVSLERIAVYLSPEAHLSLAKAFRVFGVPAGNVRTIPIDERRRMRTEELERTLAEDRARGLVPGCVCVSAGTANTGAIDPLLETAEICERHGVWLHVDGAYGALAAAVPEFAWLRDAFARADSLSLDPHKWLFAPIDVGCVLIRDDAAARAAFRLDSEYTAVTQEDPVERFAFFDRGLELSRRNRALKVWAILKTHGADELAGVIARNVDLRRHLDARVANEPRLEALGSDLSISCFRWRPAGLDDEALLAEVNGAILRGLVESGRFFLSPTTLDGRFALRICVVNFRTRRADVDLLVDEVLRLGAEHGGKSPAE